MLCNSVAAVRIFHSLAKVHQRDRVGSIDDPATMNGIPNNERIFWKTQDAKRNACSMTERSSACRGRCHRMRKGSKGPKHCSDDCCCCKTCPFILPHRIGLSMTIIRRRALVYPDTSRGRNYAQGAQD